LNKTMYSCSGERLILYSEAFLWNVSFSYSCEQAQQGFKLDLAYNVSFTHLYESNPVGFSQGAPQECRSLLPYNKFVLPNIFGQTDLGVINWASNNFLLTVGALTCYKYFYIFLCSFMYPTTTAAGIIRYPCRQMCEELLLGCGYFLEDIDLYMTCSWLVQEKEADNCMDLPVTCDVPAAPQHGLFKGENSVPMNHTFHPEDVVELICDTNYEPVPSNGQVQCQFSGSWMPNYTCRAINVTPRGSVLEPWEKGLISGIGGAVLILVSITLLYKRQKHFVDVNPVLPPGFLKRDLESYRYDIFVSYHNEAMPFIYRGEDCLRKSLEKQRYLICLHGRDFLPGNEIELNILGAVEQSRSGLCVVTEHFLESEWCLWEFSLFRHQLRNNPDFKLIMVLLGEEECLRKANKNVLEYVKCFTYLKATDEQFYQKLFKALPEPVCADVHGREPGPVWPVLTDHLV
jgi:hypothetical protein